ncbi:MAG TPA: small basic family protein [Bacillota bacterium]|nr:small basic family protein [Bacillota bacterium]HRS21456.1 small basic family protein [Clostridia bacterium]HRU41432.1 small basic family protein [Candidatus Diapherotrites archaeon]HQI17012.1 small basic family protein [Bacillota bacterium]HQJ38191.1 small basic family protein [Bacillota bacterium]
MVIIPIIGLLLGIVIGILSPITIPIQYSSYMSVAILAALDSVFGGIRSSIEKTFNIEIFMSGFFGNAVLAAILTYIGDQLGVPIYYAAIFAFGVRLFQNFAIIRRYVLMGHKKK